MSLLWADGFDSYGGNGTDISVNLAGAGYSFFSTGGPEGQFSESDTSEGYGFSVSINTTNGDGNSLVRNLAGSSTIFTGFRYKAANTNFDCIGQMGYNNFVGTWRAHIKFYANGENGITVTDEPVSAGSGISNPIAYGTVVGATPPNVLFPGVWQFIEVGLTPGGSLVVRIDNVVQLSLSGSNVSTGGVTPVVNYVAFANENANVALYDDWYINDSTGSGPFNNFLGDCIIARCAPNADASPNTMSQFGGGSGQFTSVDEQTPDGDASYIYSNTSGNQSMFTLTDPPSGITTILAIAVNVVARKSTAGIGSYEVAVKYGATQVTTGAIAAPASYVASQTIFTAPPGGGSWTVPILEALEVGVLIP